MKKYAFLFLLIYLVFSGLLAVSTELLDPKITVFLGFMVPVVGCFVTAIKFAKDSLREPDQKEVKILSWLALVGIWVISLSVPIVFFVIASPAERELSLAYVATNGVVQILLGGVALNSLISFLAIRLMFPLCAKQASRNGSVKSTA